MSWSQQKFPLRTVSLMPTHKSERCLQLDDALWAATPSDWEKNNHWKVYLEKLGRKTIIESYIWKSWTEKSCSLSLTKESIYTWIQESGEQRQDLINSLPKSFKNKFCYRQIKCYIWKFWQKALIDIMLSSICPVISNHLEVEDFEIVVHV